MRVVTVETLWQRDHAEPIVPVGTAGTILRFVGTFLRVVKFDNGITCDCHKSELQYAELMPAK